MRLHELLAEPWAITEEAYAALLERRDEEVREAKQHMLRSRLQQGPDGLFLLIPSGEEDDELDVREDGTAVIPVRGGLTRRSYWRGDRASYEWIGQRVESALERSDVRGIVLEVDSPGGQTNGADELAAQIFAGRQRKPITAFVQGQAASAAYWIASAAHRIVSGRLSMLGSIGVRWTFFDWSKYDAEIGIEQIDVVSSQSPDKAIDPTTAHGRERIQATVDHMAGEFVADVARYRGVSEETVISDFGRGWVLVGTEAQAARLADRIGVFEDAITENDTAQPGEDDREPAAKGGNVQQVHIASITAEWLEKNRPEVHVLVREEGERAGRASLEEAVAAAREELEASGRQQVEEAQANAAAAATEAERDRILGILAAGTGSGDVDNVLRSIVGGHTVDQAKATLHDAAQKRRGAHATSVLKDEDDLGGLDASRGTDGEEDDVAASVKAAGDYAQHHGR